MNQFSYLDMLTDPALSYENRKVDKTTSKSGIVVSTAYTNDCGFETALLDKNGTHPVERYETKELATEGHKRWVEFANNGNEKLVVKLGWMGLEPKDITLKV